MIVFADLELRAKRAVTDSHRLTIDPAELLELITRVRAAEEKLGTARLNVDVLLDLELDDDVRGFVAIFQEEIAEVPPPQIPCQEDADAGDSSQF